MVTTARGIFRFVVPAIIAAAAALALRFSGILGSIDARAFLLEGLGGDTKVVPWLQAVAAVLAALGAAYATVSIRWFPHRLIVILLGAAQVVTLSFVLANYGMAFGPADPLIALFLGWTIAEILGMTKTGRQRSALRRAVGDRAGEHLIDRLVQAGGLPALMDGPRTVAVAVFQLANAEEFHELPIQTRTTVLGEAHASLEDRLRKAGAYIVQRDAQVLAAVFGLDAGADAHRSAVELASELSALSAVAHREGVAAVVPVPDWRIGLESGEAFGVFLDHGGSKTLTFTSSALHRAALFAAENLRFGSHVCAGGEFQSAAGEAIEVRPLDLVSVPGHAYREEIYEVLGPMGTLDAEQAASRDAFWKGVVLVREGRFADAVEMLKQARRSGTEDRPLRYYLELATSRLDRGAGGLERAGAEVG